jgi:hypothetical protein
MASQGHKPNELFTIADAASQIAHLATKLTFATYRRGCAWLRKQVGADLGDLSFGTLRGGIKFRTGGVLESSHIGAT